MLKMNFSKTRPTETNYRNYRHLDEASFKEDLKTAFINDDMET